MELPPEAYKLLNMIASVESPGYDVMYGGSRFTGFEDHPGQYHTITSGPNKGKKSSAAGRYQFLESTWDKIANKYGLKDFSPENQDRAAWALAQEDYKRNTGNDLMMDLRNGNLKNIRRGIGPTWEGLAKANDSAIVPMFARAPAAPGLTLNSPPPVAGPTMAAAASLPAAAPEVPQTMGDKMQGMFKNQDFKDALGQITGGASGGGGEWFGQASQISPSAIGADGQQGAITASAAQLMSSILNKRRGGGVPGLSLMG